MPKPDPRRALARTLEQSVAASVAKKTVALHLSRQEWTWVIAALRLAAGVEKEKTDTSR